MSKTILHQPLRRFVLHCTGCECDFDYELCDVEQGMVSCPACFQRLQHSGDTKLSMPAGSRLQVINDEVRVVPPPTSTEPCYECAWTSAILNNRTAGLTGQAPCTWCEKRAKAVVRNVTVNGPSLQSLLYKTVELEDVVDKLDAETCNCGPNAVCSKCSVGSGTITATNCGFSESQTATQQSKTATTVNCLCKGDVWKSCSSCTAENSCHNDSEHSCECKHTN
jgi:hypothetical protein